MDCTLNILISNKNQIFEIIRFGIVGVGATLVHLISALFLSAETNLNIFFINTLAFLVAFGVSFTGHYFWTFKSSAPKMSSLVKFFGVAITGLLASSLMIMALIYLGIHNDFIKLTISILIIPAVTFTVGKIWVFKT